MTNNLMDIVLAVIILIGVIVIGYLANEIIKLAKSNLNTEKSGLELKTGSNLAPDSEILLAPNMGRQIGSNFDSPIFENMDGDIDFTGQGLGDSDFMVNAYNNEYDDMLDEYNNEYHNQYDDDDETTIIMDSNTGNKHSFARVEFFQCAGRSTGQIEFLMQDTTVFGRDKGADINIADRTVSMRQMKIVLEQNRLWIEDLNSSNGTFLNRKCVMYKTEINNGDVVNIGNTAFSIKLMNGSIDTYDGPYG